MKSTTLSTSKYENKESERARERERERERENEIERGSNIEGERISGWDKTR